MIDITSPPHPTATVLRPLQAASLAAVPWLRHSFSTRHGGVTTVYGRSTDLNLGFTPLDDAASVQQNRHRLREATASPGESWPIVTARQVHSAIVRTVCSADQPAGEADALLTATPSLLLGILTADCVPILLADTRRRVVAAIHAGWRGTAARIVEHAVRAMHDQFGSAPEDVLAAIGPSIGPCCYEVGAEVRHAFSSDPDLIHNNRLDLWQANRRQLLAAGLLANRIEILAQCTACTRDEDGAPRFFSHRAEHGRTGRMISLIGFAAESSQEHRLA